jgi:hypothetical protein
LCVALKTGERAPILCVQEGIVDVRLSAEAGKQLLRRRTVAKRERRRAVMADDIGGDFEIVAHLFAGRHLIVQQDRRAGDEQRRAYRGHDDQPELVLIGRSR